MILLFTPLFGIFLLGLAIAVFLLPNLIIIWLLRKKLHISERLGGKAFWLSLPVLLAIASNSLISGIDPSIWPGGIGYSLAILSSFVAIDYCLVSGKSFQKIIGTIFYFILLSFCEFVVFSIIDKELHRWQPPVGLL